MLITIIDEIIDETDIQKKTHTEKNKGNRSYSERMRAKLFCCAFKLGFLQLIREASLIFNSKFRVSFMLL